MATTSDEPIWKFPKSIAAALDEESAKWVVAGHVFEETFKKQVGHIRRLDLKSRPVGGVFQTPGGQTYLASLRKILGNAHVDEIVSKIEEAERQDQELES